MNEITDTSSFSLLPDSTACDPIEARLRASVGATIETMFEEELAEFLGRMRYDRGDGGAAKGCRHGHRDRQLTGTFGTETVRVPRARVETEEGSVREWRSKALPRYQRLTKKADTRHRFQRHRRTAALRPDLRVMRRDQRQHPTHGHHRLHLRQKLLAPP